MLAILSLGFLLGLQHALEADHVAAVSSIAARRSEIGDIVRHGLIWGLGHTLTLFAFAGAALLLGQVIPAAFSHGIETAVGLMLVVLGAHVLWRLWCDRGHFHGHSHGGGNAHFHAHGHAGATMPRHGFRWRTLLVGLMHGMAGSAALLVLVVASAPAPLAGLFYILLFGAGSMLGMAALSTLIAVPIAFSARGLTHADHALQAAVGLVAIAVGLRAIVARVIA
jgi:cytochrome c biogenesis protein CcdA